MPARSGFAARDFMRLLQRIKYAVLSHYRCYKVLERWYRRLAPGPSGKYYPTLLGIELTTLCNSKCRFCTHDTLVHSGQRKAGHMPLAFANQVLERLRELVRLQGVPERAVHFSPTGLGSPLLYPHLFDVIDRARQLFPKAHIRFSSNGIELTGEVVDRLIGSAVDSNVFSLCYNDPGTYFREMGVDKYGVVRENLENYLRRKGDRGPRAIIHIFDVPENREAFPAFIRQWAPLLGKGDFAGLYGYLALTDRSPRAGVRYPCSQLWNVLMVDLEGYVFPCCLGTWRERDDDLCLGRIGDDFAALLARLAEVRARHMAGDYRGCAECAYLSAGGDENRRHFARLKRRGLVP